MQVLDLKSEVGRAAALDAVARAEALIEGFRPGVMERLGLGPADCAARNPALVYGRMTGWGQTGPLAQAAGHDLNYVALSGLLGLGARPETPPRVPPTVLGDAGGALALAFGIVSAVLAARATGQGRVVDAAIVDAVAMLGGLAQWIGASGQLGGPAPSPFHDSPSTTATAVPMAGTSPSGRWSRPSMPNCCGVWGWMTWTRRSSTTRRPGRR